MPAIRGLGFLGRTRERERLDAVLAQARAGQSAVLVIRGEPGIGKTALLRYAARQASGLRTAEVEGVQAEMELAVRGDPSVVRAAARRARGARRAAAERAPRRLGRLVGRRPGQVPRRRRRAQPARRDRRGAPAPVPGGRRAVARRRLGAGARVRRAAPAGGTGGDDLLAARADHHAARSTACRSSSLEGLDEPDARALLSRAVPGRLDDRVRDRIIAETGGNPLALVELSQRMSPAERAGGFAPPAAGDLPSRLEERVPAARRRAARGDAATDPAGGGGAAGRRHPAVAGGRTTLAPTRARWLPRRKPGCWRSTTAFASTTRWCAQRSTEPRRSTNDGAYTTRWRR